MRRGMLALLAVLGVFLLIVLLVFGSFKSEVIVCLRDLVNELVEVCTISTGTLNRVQESSSLSLVP